MPTDPQGPLCRHARGEYGDDYQRCLDCGQERILIGGVWFDVEAWIQMSVEFLTNGNTVSTKGWSSDGTD